jgi:hypothetical protein
MMKKAVLGNRKSPELSRFCSEALARQGKNAHDLFRVLRLAYDQKELKQLPTEKAIERFLEGGRTIGLRALRRLTEEICSTPPETQRFRALLDGLRDSSLTAARIDEPRTYRYFSVPYPPLSGAAPKVGDRTSVYFMEKLLHHLGQLAFLDWQVDREVDDKVTDGHFDMNDRIQALLDGRADVLINLVSLPRLRKLRFITTPISISLNGVVLKDVPDVETVVDDATGFLSGSTELGPSSQLRFRAVTITGEVGSVHVKWMNERLHPTQQLRPEVASTLKHQELARRVRASAGDGLPLVLFCDELTALGVLQALGGRGRLLFPLNSDASIARFHHRRRLPVHQLGIGYPSVRSKRPTDMDRIVSLFRMFLESEREMVTAFYLELYEQLKAHVNGCLEQSPDLYVGGVRRVRREEVTGEYLPELTLENTRAHVRRCLHLSRGTIALHREDDPWTPILSRAREHLQIQEARNRPAVRASLLTALSMAAGLDPCKQKISTKAAVKVALENRTQLRQLLERDLDVVLPPDDAFFDSLEAAPRSAGIERFVSVLQEVLEKSTRTTHVTVVLDRSGVSGSVRAEVDRRFQEWRKSVEGRDEHRRLALIGQLRPSMKIALALGEPVGVLFYKPRPRTKELIYIWVAQHMRKGNTGPLLVRKVIEDAANDPNVDDVSFEERDTPPRVVQWFKGLGFSKARSSSYLYQLERLNARPYPIRRSAAATRNR